jgi:Lon protease-like protein
MAVIELPIFPLGIVLFPGTPQLLHVFEPRYRQMLADCLEGDRRFGISYVPAGDDPDPAPAAGDVGCTALVKQTRLLPDGRSNVLAVGEDRYVLRAYAETDLPYRVARVETFDDVDAEAPQLPEVATEVRAGFRRFVEGMQTLSDRLPADPVELSPDAKLLSFQVAAGLEIDPAVKQELLALRSTLDRLTQVNRILRPLNEELGRRVAVHVRARGNGKGGAMSDVVKGQ